MTGGAGKISIDQQIAEVMRELAMRRNVYPGLVGRGRMRQSEADLCTVRMEAVLATLKFCQTFEPAIRDYVASLKDGGDA